MRWQRYWFADGGRIAAAFVRVAIALAVLASLDRLASLSTVDLPGNPELYRPIGIWMVLGHGAPSATLVTVLWIAAWVGSAAMLVGLFTRTATVVSFVGAGSLAALSFATKDAWSHQYNVVFLAQLAFLGARGGDCLSVDALIRRMRGLPQLDIPGGYQWSLRLVQLAIALMFAGAVFHKVLHGHFTLRWALSDNLRHHLLVRYDLAGLPRPEIVDWLLEESWRWRAAALANMIAQLLPIAACLFVRRPLVRLACGMVFASEVILLGAVMSLWNEHWLPLIAAFVDWDRLNAWLVGVELPPRAVAPGIVRRIWVIVFVVYEAIVSFVPALDQRLNTYPFSGFPMFATIRANAPYDEHLPYSVPGDRFVVTADAPLDADQQRWFDYQNRGVYTIADPVRLEARLRKLLADARARFPANGIRGVRAELVIFEAPPYPQPARFDAYPIATVGELAPDGTFHTLLGGIAGNVVTIGPRGVDASHAQLVYYADDRPVRQQLAATRTGDRFTVELAADPAFIVALVDSTPWLVATRRSWKWQ